jgi:MtrB/PioB family decaheme-associated outer membrane protein
MRRFAFILITGLGIAVPSAVLAQGVTPEAPAQAKPPQAPQTPPQAPAAAAAPAEDETFHSLFELSPRQFLIGGRFNSVDGDPARFQRYQDMRDGLLFTEGRYASQGTGGSYFFNAAADNVGFRDQRYSASYERTGRFVLSGLWDSIPQFYSVDTQTPFTPAPGTSPLRLDDATQQRIQNGQANMSAYVPLATQFDLRERRDIGTVSFLATPNKSFDVTGTFTSTKHSGELPWGASFGFNNDNEVALPYDSRTNDFTIGTEWMKGKNMLRFAYTGSWFNNLDDTLVWDNPLRLTDSTSAPAQGRTALWPSNSAQTFSGGGYTKLAHRTQITGNVAFGVWRNDDALLPFTINSALTQLTLPRTTTEGSAHTFSTNISLVTRPKEDWSFAARFRDYNYGNHTPQAAIPQFINYDTSVATSATGGPELYAHNRLTFDADATWTHLQPLSLTVGYSRNNSSHDFRVFDSTGENVFRVTADMIGSSWVSFRGQYEFSDKNGSGLNEDLLTEIGERAEMRHFDIADRTRNRFTGQVDMSPSEEWTFSVSGGTGKDNFPDSGFGLQDSTFNTLSFAADYHLPNGFGYGGTYNYERYSGFQKSRTSDTSTAQFNDPNRDWTTDSKEQVNYFSIYATPPRFGKNTEARVSYDFSYAEGNYLYGIVAGGPLPTPSQLPKVYNKLQQLHLDVRHQLTPRLILSFSYLYEPFRVFDFAMDPSVVNGIVQPNPLPSPTSLPNTLVMGYVYRPYTANAGVIGLKYVF